MNPDRQFRLCGPGAGAMASLQEFSYGASVQPIESKEHAVRFTGLRYRDVRGQWPDPSRQRKRPESHGRMSRVEFEQGAFSVDANLIAEGLGIEAARVQPAMRDGSITSLCERGLGDDSGHYRLTFFHGTLRFRLVVDAAGNVIEKSATDIGEHGRTASKRKRRR